MSEHVLQVQLTAAYGKRAVLRDLAFDLSAGEALGVVGSSGAGKTTLVMALLGLLAFHGGRSTGKVLIQGKNLLRMTEREARRIRGRLIGLIPQSPMTALNPAITLEAHFQAAWRAHESTGNQALRLRLRQSLEEVQLPADDDAFLLRKPGQISVGQAQRVLIALALLHHPSILIADEPTSALDPVTQSEIVKLLQRLTRRHGVAMLYISHDLISVLELCDRLAVLHDGAIAECIPVRHLEQATHPATRTLFGSLPVPISVLLAHFAARMRPQSSSDNFPPRPHATLTRNGAAQTDHSWPEDEGIALSANGAGRYNLRDT